MKIVETPVYTEDITKLLNDEEYWELQSFLVEHPTFGDLIQGSKGLRKLRWNLKNKGKSGGIIYITTMKRKKLYIWYMFMKKIKLKIWHQNK